MWWQVQTQSPMLIHGWGVGGRLEKSPCVLGVPDSPLKMARL